MSVRSLTLTCLIIYPVMAKIFSSLFSTLISCCERCEVWMFMKKCCLLMGNYWMDKCSLQHEITWVVMWLWRILFIWVMACFLLLESRSIQPIIHRVKCTIWILRGVVALYQLVTFLASQLTLQCFPQHRERADVLCWKCIDLSHLLLRETL